MPRLLRVVGLALIVAVSLGPAACAHRGAYSGPPSADLFRPSDPPQGSWGRSSQETEHLRPTTPAHQPAAQESTLRPMTPPPVPPSARQPAPPGMTVKPITPAPAPAPTSGASPTSGGYPSGQDSSPRFVNDVRPDSLPLPLERAYPVYPDSARDAGIQGVVVLRALVRTNGLVGDVRVLRSVPGLDDAAVSCLWAWRFRPAMLKGRPVEAWTEVPVRFSIH